MGMKGKKIKVKAYCHYEIGDKVRFKKGGNVHVMEVTDIIVETSVKDGTSKFRLELDGWYMLDTTMLDIEALRGQQ